MRVLSSILWKEAKGLQPFFIFMLVFFVVGLLSTQFAEFMDEKPFWGSLWDRSAIRLHYLIITILLIISFIGTLGILPREKEEGSLTFLEGLPIKRSTVYFAKWLVVFLIVTTFLILLFCEILVYEWLALDSTSEATPWSHLLTFYLLCLFLCAFFVSVLFPLSFLRLWSFLIIIVYAFAVYIMIAWRIPYASYLNPFQLVQPPLEIENAWPIPWGRLIAFSFVGILAYVAGLGLFSRIPATSVKPEKPFHKTVGGWIVLVIAGGFGLLLTLGMIVGSMVEQLGEETVAGAKDIKQAQTTHFDFLYRDEMTDRIAPLIRDADDIFLEVADVLQSKENRSRIVVDLTRPLARHNAGQANWNKKTYTLDEAKAVFGHEVTHVIIDRISSHRLSKVYSSRWFHEGLASYIEFTRFRKSGGDEKYQRWLALASTWDDRSRSHLCSG